MRTRFVLVREEMIGENKMGAESGVTVISCISRLSFSEAGRVIGCVFISCTPGKA
jgi:hypothetical protein